MNTPPFYNFKFVDPQGNLTPEAQLFMSSVNQAMVGALSDDGWTVPQKDTDDIDTLAASDLTPVGTIWFDTDEAKLKVKTANAVISPATPAVVETITSAVVP